jgi:serine/threonine-protein kinase
MLRQALAIRMRVYGPNHQSVASTLNELGRVAQQQGRLDDAETNYRRMIEIYKAIYNDKHYLIGVALSNLGGVYTDRKQYREAEQLFREALRRYAETLPADHLYVGIAQIKMGRALLLQGRYADAERATLAGYKIVGAQSNSGVTWLQNARKDLIAEYEGLKQPVEAAKYRVALDGAAPGAPSPR